MKDNVVAPELEVAVGANPEMSMCTSDEVPPDTNRSEEEMIDDIIWSAYAGCTTTTKRSILYMVDAKGVATVAKD